MAKAFNGYMGPFVGKLGTAVGYLWKGRPVLRAYVQHIRYPNTAQQQAERDWFVGMVRFAAATRGALLLGLRDGAAQEQMTEGNYFIKRNKQHFHRLLTAAAGAASTQSRQSSVDYRRLQLSAGPVAPVAPTQASVDDDGTLTVVFDKNGMLRRSKGADSVHLLVYNAAERRAVMASPTLRRNGRITLLLPDLWADAELHLYLFATDAEGHASPSEHITTGATDGTPDIDNEGLASNTGFSSAQHDHSLAQVEGMPTSDYSPPSARCSTIKAAD